MAALLALLCLAGTAAASSLPGRIDGLRSREHAAHSRVNDADKRISRQGERIADIQRRLDGIQKSLDIQQRLLASTQARSRAAQSHLASLRARLKRDRKVLSQQLIAGYKTPPPTLLTAVTNAHGFEDLLEQVDAARAVTAANTRVTTRVTAARRAVAKQATRLAAIEARRAQITRSIVLQRDEVAEARLAVVDAQLAEKRHRDAAASTLSSLRSKRRTLQARLDKARAAAAAAARAPLPATGGGGGDGGGADSTSAGGFGFFQASGTDYSHGVEPELASRLGRMGKALHLHLIGISGYRTPQHSVEVGGFANDPHTQGQASDTPGVEGVPEGTLRRFGLTRPFGGAAEADHIQLAG